MLVNKLNSLLAGTSCNEMLPTTAPIKLHDARSVQAYYEEV